MRQSSLHCLLMACTLLAFHALPSRAAVFLVDNTQVSGPGSLQQALLDVVAAPIDIHEVRFSPSFPQGGVIQYASEHLVLSTPVLVIDGMDRQPVLSRTNAPLLPLLLADDTLVQLTLRSLTVRDVRATNAAACLSSSHPAGANLILRDVEFRNCESSNLPSSGTRLGGAINWSAEGLVDIQRSTFVGNRVTNNDLDTPTTRAGGGALYSRAGVVVEDSIFNGNAALGHNPSGGAIEVEGASLQVGPATVFTQNAAGVPGQASGSAYGGAVSVRQGDVDVDSTRMAMNQAWSSATARGGALAVQAVNALVDIRNSRFDGNDAIDAGGAVLLQCDNCEHVVERNVFDSNRGDFGAAVRIDSSDFAQVALAQVVNNAFLRPRVGEDRSAYGNLSLRNISADIAHNTFLEDPASLLHPNDISALDVLSPLATQLRVLNNLFGRRADGTTCYLSGNVAVTAAGNFGPDASCAQFQADIGDSSQLAAPVWVDQGILTAPTFPDSALVDGAASPCIVNEDLFGRPRPLDGDGNNIAICDVGAYEHGFDGIFRDGFEDD